MREVAIMRLYVTDEIYFDPTVTCLIGKKSRFLSSDEFRLSMEYGLPLIKEKMKEYPAIGWIAHLSQSNVVDPEDKRWMMEYRNPAEVKAGLKYIAFIMPESDFVNNGLEKYIKQSV